MSAPTYGGWRRVRAIGVGDLDGRQTLMLAVSVMVPLILTFPLGARALLWMVPLALLTAGAAVWTRRGVWIVDLARAQVAYTRARLAGRTHYRGQLWAPYPRRKDLPGLLASTRLLTFNDGAGPAGLLWNRRSGMMSATYLLSPTGALLTDDDTATYRVQSWGLELANLANNPAISHAAVTIEMVPSTGTDLSQQVAERAHPGAPDLARQVMQEVVAAAPVTTTQMNARMTISVDTAKTPAKSVHEAVVETLRALGGLSLHASGVDVLRRATGSDLVRMVRTAYDPPSAQTTETAQWDQLMWEDAGPVSADEERGHYVHDGAISQTWCLVAAPRQQVRHDVLLPLLLPGPYIQRVTLLYRTLSREQAGAVLKREKDAVSTRRMFDHQSGKDPSARNDEDAARAAQAAMEEAQGAGLTEFSLFVTVTVQDGQDMGEARRYIEQAASQARLQIRPCWGGQAGAFQVGLGVAGLYPPKL